MVSVDYKQERHHAMVCLVMLVIAILFLLYMGDSLVDSTREFWSNCQLGKILH